MSADAMQTPGPILATAPVLSDATTSPHTLALLLFVLTTALLVLVAWWQRHSPEGQRVAVTVVALVAAAPSPVSEERIGKLCAEKALFTPDAFCALDSSTRALLGLLVIGVAFNVDLVILGALHLHGSYAKACRSCCKTLPLALATALRGACASCAKSCAKGGAQCASALMCRRARARASASAPAPAEPSAAADAPAEPPAEEPKRPHLRLSDAEDDDGVPRREWRAPENAAKSVRTLPPIAGVSGLRLSEVKTDLREIEQTMATEASLVESSHRTADADALSG